MALIREHQDANQTHLGEVIRLLELAQKAFDLFRKRSPVKTAARIRTIELHLEWSASLRLHIANRLTCWIKVT